jgi:phosphoglycolate phosphatase
MARKIDLLIFDLDGTLVDTRADLAGAVNHALAELGLKTLTVDEVMNYVGNGLKKLMERSLGTELQARLPEAIAIFRDYYKHHLLDESKPYPGVVEVLRHFRDKKMAVISNKPLEFTAPMIEQLEFSDYFNLVLGGDSVPEMKPNPAPVLHVMRELGVDAGKTVMIGDGNTDIDAANAANVDSCAVTYGYRSAELLARSTPDHMIAQISELTALYN